MLSYRHSYHAGNFADVLKHIVLIEMLEYVCRKVAPFDYIDTHSGAGLFDLRSEHASKLQEYRAGIAKLQPADFPELSRYFEILDSFNQQKGPARYAGSEPGFYPGSPLIARRMLRPQDRSWLFELHPTDFALLKENMAGDRRSKVSQEDGFRALMGLLPPHSRRAVVLMDPSFEVKSDYAEVFATLMAARRKFPSGIYALWYPVVRRKQVDELLAQFENSGIRNIQQFELAITADAAESGSAGKGMTAAGLLVINPPWILMERMQSLLPRLARALGRDESAFYTARVLVDE